MRVVNNLLVSYKSKQSIVSLKQYDIAIENDNLSKFVIMFNIYPEEN